MIVYVDTSALVPLIISEPTSTAAQRLWDAAGRVVATPLVYVEAHSALAQAQRLGRITLAQLRRGLKEARRHFSKRGNLLLTFRRNERAA